MAFYFALLNVSTKREDRNNSSSSHRQRRRRHSIASVESPILDYRLLPRPQVVGNEAYHTEQEGEPSSRQHEHRSASYSRLRDEIPRREHDARRPTNRNSKEIKYRRMKKSSSSHFSSSRKQKHKSENGLEKDFGTLKVQSSSTSKRDDSEKNRGVKVNGTTAASSSHNVNSRLKTVPKMNQNKSRDSRPVVIRRRLSPQESSTSDSRRSSNMSTLSPPRNDSLGSSTSSTRVNETIPEASSPSNLTLSSAITPKLSISSKAAKMTDLPRSSTLKKVTFENDSSHLFVNNSFLGDQSVLILRSSGSTFHRPSTTQPLSPPTLPLTLRPFAKGTTTLASFAYGATLWAPFSTVNEGTPRRQNATNDAIEETSRQTGIGSLLRRHSTSDRHVLYGFQNEGFHLMNDETPHAELHKTSSGATLLSYTG